MIHIYLFTMVLGGVVLLASIVLGGKDGDAGHEGDAGEAGEAGEAEVEAHGDVEGILNAFLSLRFWTFALTFFGLTGLVLDGVLGHSWLAIVFAVLLGLGAGLTAVTVLRRLAASETSTAASERDYVGKVGRVLLPFGQGQTGKVRLTLKGTTVDVLASTDEERPFEPGEDALIIHMNDTIAAVVRPTGRDA